MTPSEASDLLTHCAMFDNRQPSAAAAVAWSTSLKDVPLDPDAFSAVARFYGTPPAKPGERLWIQPHDVKSHRLAIRRERLGETLPAYEPPLELETGAEFIARRRAQLDAVATGRIPTAPVGELTGGPAPEVALKLAGIGRRVEAVTPEELAAEIALEEGEQPVAPEVEQVRRPGPLGVKCPKCSAAIGRPCRTPGGKERATHPARGKPPTDPDVEAREMERRREVSRRHLTRLEGGSEQAGDGS